jgi:hypothetical protein
MVLRLRRGVNETFQSLDVDGARLSFVSMVIEERELHYSPDSPLRAWRLFRVRAFDADLVLSSPMYHDPDPPPWPDVGSVASCYEDHPAPAAGCRCGIYAAVPGTLDSLPGYLRDTAYDDDLWAYAEIACSGRVFVDMRGVRAERASPFPTRTGRTRWRSTPRSGCSTSATAFLSAASTASRTGLPATSATQGGHRTR